MYSLRNIVPACTDHLGIQMLPRQLLPYRIPEITLTRSHNSDFIVSSRHRMIGKSPAAGINFLNVHEIYAVPKKSSWGAVQAVAEKEEPVAFP